VTITPTGPLLARQGEGVRVLGPALGLVETSSIARGLVVADQMCKRAQVTLVLARPVSPGKHLVLVSGDVAEVGEAMQLGVATAQQTLVDRLELAQVAPGLLAALGRQTVAPVPDLAVGILETFSVASTLLAADAACKAAAVELIELRLADGLGGKGYFVLGGEQADVDAALIAAEAAVPVGLLVSRELIPRPHADLLDALLRR
jgi:microcompartment protein CcmL/EutN